MRSKCRCYCRHISGDKARSVGRGKETLSIIHVMSGVSRVNYVRYSHGWKLLPSVWVEWIEAKIQKKPTAGLCENKKRSQERKCEVVHQRGWRWVWEDHHYRGFLRLGGAGHIENKT